MLGAVPRAIEEKRAEDAPEYYAYYVPATEKEKRASPDFADDIVA